MFAMFCVSTPTTLVILPLLTSIVTTINWPNFFSILRSSSFENWMTVNNNYKITHSLYFLSIANCETADSQPATTRSFFDGLFWGLSRAIRPTHAGGTLVKNGHLCQAKF